MEKPNDMSEKDKYLLKAILYLLLYAGLGGEEGGLKSLLVSSHNPITDYGRSKTMMGG